MKKIPTLFVKKFDEQGNAIAPISNEVTQGMEWVLKGEGIATRKYDGTCCLINNGKMYARFDYKPGRQLPQGAVPCQDKADENSGHFPHWVEVKDQQNYKWHKLAFEKQKGLPNGTYELCGEHFKNNIDGLVENGDVLVPHGKDTINVERTFEGIKKYLENENIEGIVFWKNGEPKCKIRKIDFGFKWNKKGELK